MKNISRIAIAGAVFATFGLGQAVAENWDMPVPYSDKTFHTVNISEFANGNPPNI